MNTREDFEIYTFERNGQKWYGFKVDYFGIYSAPSEEKILEIRKKIKRKVKAKLEWVERENQKYYARLAEEERQRALLFREAKELERKIDDELSQKQKRLRSKVIYEMMERGMTNTEIMGAVNAPFRVVSRLRREYNKAHRGERM